MGDCTRENQIKKKPLYFYFSLLKKKEKLSSTNHKAYLRPRKTAPANAPRQLSAKDANASRGNSLKHFDKKTQTG